ncbi:MAG: hypothetical protein IJC11_02025 [Alphaproteobacteria bacterium]|nr:hypothetical protein [Alphaproteobacteria bacterium]MBQ3117083.1 hypothetical protein [Alphaproteobacteria bacterium]MBQ6854916.1 hypothetical protein [Alphaproteobacteria bacterium]MBQ8557570.1 hypothetical protein [Alphaproteobacteria bacterium]MBR3913205.1 hypothetical protein [Alphaproteobacteria bacterium]
MTVNRLKYYCLQLFPFFLICGFVFFKSLSFNLFGFSQSYLTNVYAVIFYCAVFNATVLNIFTVFFLGILTDILLDIPFGLSPFLYSFVFFIGYFNRRFLRQTSFNKQWFVFNGVITCIFLFGLGFLKFLYGGIPHIQYLIVEWLLLMCCYPLVAAVVGYVNQRMGRYI